MWTPVEQVNINNVHDEFAASKENDEKEIMRTTMDMYLKRVTLRQEEPQAQPSGGIPEEGIVVIGNDSSMAQEMLKIFQ